MNQKIKINNFTGKKIVLLCGHHLDEEPEASLYLEHSEEADIEINPAWDRIAINNAAEKEKVDQTIAGVSFSKGTKDTTAHRPGDVTKEEFDKVVAYVRDAVWTKKSDKK